MDIERTDWWLQEVRVDTEKCLKFFFILNKIKILNDYTASSNICVMIKLFNENQVFIHDLLYV